MFIHSTTLPIRLAALLSIGASTFLGWLLWPLSTRGIATTSGMLLFALLVFSAVALFFGGVLIFLKAESLAEKRELPDASSWSGPNNVNPKRRLAYVTGALFLLGYGVWSLARDDFFIPGKRTSIHLHGAAAWFMFLSSLSAVVGLLSVVVDHYDRRNNELRYANAAAASRWLAWTFFIAALLKHTLA